jgi:hypothetical protein
MYHIALSSHYSLCLNKTTLCNQLWGIWAVSKAWLLWIICNEHGCASGSTISWNTVLTYMLRIDITGFYGNSIFSFLRDLYTAFQSGYTNFDSHQKCRCVLFHHKKAKICCYLWYPFWLGLGRFSGCFDCISFISKNGRHFFMYLLAICTSSFENCLFSSFAHLFSELFIHWEGSFLSFLYILVINPLTDA